jgi:hypothetical protein
MTHAQWEEVRGRFDQWAGSYAPSHLSGGRIGIDFGDDEMGTIFLDWSKYDGKEA